MTNKKENIYEILLKKKAGLCTEQEVREIEDRLLTDPEAQIIWKDINADVHGIWKDPGTDQAWERLQHQFARHHRKKVVPILVKAAAVIILAVILLTLLRSWPRKLPVARNTADTTRSYITLPGGETFPLKQGGPGDSSSKKGADNPTINMTAELPQGANKGRVFVNSQSIYKFILPDGSIAYSNSNTIFSFDFSASARTITMEGEMYFEVFPDAARPFTVKTEGCAIEVLGTAFNVNTYGKGNRVSLLSGTVEVIAARKSVKLQPGYHTELKDGDLEVAENKDDNEISWMQGWIHFDSVTVAEVIEQMRNSLSMPITCSNPEAATKLVSCGFRRGMQPDKWVQWLCSGDEFTYKKVGDTIVVTVQQLPKE